MQAAYLNSPHFKDIYMAVGMNKMPSKARTTKKLESDLMNAVYMSLIKLIHKLPVLFLASGHRNVHFCGVPVKVHAPLF